MQIMKHEIYKVQGIINAHVYGVHMRTNDDLWSKCVNVKFATYDKKLLSATIILIKVTNFHDGNKWYFILFLFLRI